MVPFMPAFMPEVPLASSGTGIVEPDVHAGNQFARQGKIVALHHQYLADEFRHLGDIRDVPYQFLARDSADRLAGKDEDHRAVRTVQYCAQPVESPNSIVARL